MTQSLGRHGHREVSGRIALPEANDDGRFAHRSAAMQPDDALRGERLPRAAVPVPGRAGEVAQAEGGHRDGGREQRRCLPAPGDEPRDGCGRRRRRALQRGRELRRRSGRDEQIVDAA